jgi:hypothetical protein
MTASRAPAVDGWFTIDDEPALLGNTCSACGTVFFPKASLFCRNPDCAGEEFEETRLSRRGRIWSYTDAQYQPPPPYVVFGEEYVPFALAAVELPAEQLVVLGQVANGFSVSDLAVGQTVELVVEPLFRDDAGVERMVYRWRPVEPVG